MKLLQVFNRYLHPGGEEKSVDRIHQHLSYRHQVTRCFYDSADWKSATAPGPLKQARLLFGNEESAAKFERCIADERPQAALFHNLYPVGSALLYRTAQRQQLPIIQYLHNFRPFSPGGTLFAKGKLITDALPGRYLPEVLSGSWQGSVLKTALFALMLKKLHRSGWLDSVRQWVAISDFMRDRLIESGLSPERIRTLRHSWDAMPEPPALDDDGSYLYLGRLVEEKGILPMIEAWNRLYREKGPAAPLLKIAGDGPLTATVKQAQSTNPRIHALGHIDGPKKSHLLQKCRAVIVPSIWWEPLGIVVYEAYDHQKLVLAAISGGLTETVTHHRTGLLHTPGDVAQIVQQVLACESMSADQRTGMGSEGRAWLLRETNVSQWQERFDAILACATAPPSNRLS